MLSLRISCVNVTRCVCYVVHIIIAFICEELVSRLLPRSQGPLPCDIILVTSMPWTTIPIIGLPTSVGIIVLLNHL